MLRKKSDGSQDARALGRSVRLEFTYASHYVNKNLMDRMDRRMLKKGFLTANHSCFSSISDLY